MFARPILPHALLPALFTASVLGCGQAPSKGGAQSPENVVGSSPATNVISAAAAPRPPRADASLLHRNVIFSDPDRAMPKISHDGKRLAFLAPYEGVLNVWVAPVEEPSAAKPVTQEKKRGIRRYEWTFTGDHLLYLQDKDGDENWHVWCVDLKDGTNKDLTPIEGVNAELVGISHLVPGRVEIGLNDRDKRFHDLYEVDVRSGERKLVQKNDGFRAFVTDEHFKVRFGLKPQPDGGFEMLTALPKDQWKSFAKVALEDTLTTQPVDFDKSEKTLFMKDSRGRDTSALVALDLASGKTTLLAEDAKADVGDVLIHPTEKRIEAVRVNYDRARWKVVDKALEKDFAALAAVADGDMFVTSRTLDEKRWVVAYVLSDGPARYYLYDRDAKKATFLFSNQKSLENVKLAKLVPNVIKSRDGLDLVSYLTLPPDVTTSQPSQPLPMVLFVHGGPWARDEWGLNRYHQWLATRGYAVLSVNYRGSTGFGKRFINASTHEWAGKMHDDLLDAVDWAVSQKIADPAKVAIMGGSYGGYSTLVGLTFTPDTFACGVDIVGPSNLVTLLNSIPPYWATELDRMAKLIGDPRTEDGKKLLLERSPLTRVDAIRRPLLIGQGANDPRVKQAESDQIVKAMQERKIPVSYVLFPDEGHGFARPANRLAFNAVSEVFLAQCLGGSYEPVGQDFQGSTISIPEGADKVYGIADELKRKK